MKKIKNKFLVFIALLFTVSGFFSGPARAEEAKDCWFDRLDSEKVAVPEFRVILKVIRPEKVTAAELGGFMSQTVFAGLKQNGILSFPRVSAKTPPVLSIAYDSVIPTEFDLRNGEEAYKAGIQLKLEQLIARFPFIAFQQCNGTATALPLVRIGN